MSVTFAVEIIVYQKIPFNFWVHWVLRNSQCACYTVDMAYKIHKNICLLDPLISHDKQGLTEKDGDVILSLFNCYSPMTFGLIK